MEMPYVGYSQEDRAYMSTHNHEHYPDYKFIIYSASQLQSEDIYWDILKKMLTSIQTYQIFLQKILTKKIICQTFMIMQ